MSECAQERVHPLESKDHAFGGAWHPNTQHGSQGTGARLSEFFWSCQCQESVQEIFAKVLPLNKLPQVPGRQEKAAA